MTCLYPNGMDEGLHQKGATCMPLEDIVSIDKMMKKLNVHLSRVFESDDDKC
jgi:hypothetical protein